MLAFLGYRLCVLLYAWFAIAQFIFESIQAYRVFKLKLNTYLAFKITFDKERLPLLPIQLAEF
jgi:hypothetical protein